MTHPFNSSLYHARSSSIANGYATTNTYRSTFSNVVSSVSSSGISLSYAELPQIKIAPKTSVFVAEYYIFNKDITDCDLIRFPSDSSSIKFTDEESPIHFGNFFVYSIDGSDKEYIVQNKFYVSGIKNIAWPSIFKYIERIC